MNYIYLILQTSIDPAQSFALYFRQFREKTEQMNSILETSNKLQDSQIKLSLKTPLENSSREQRIL
jgi:hypothetical protein